MSYWNEFLFVYQQQQRQQEKRPYCTSFFVDNRFNRVDAMAFSGYCQGFLLVWTRPSLLHRRPVVLWLPECFLTSFIRISSISSINYSLFIYICSFYDCFPTKTRNSTVKQTTGKNIPATTKWFSFFFAENTYASYPNVLFFLANVYTPRGELSVHHHQYEYAFADDDCVFRPSLRHGNDRVSMGSGIRRGVDGFFFAPPADPFYLFIYLFFFCSLLSRISYFLFLGFSGGKMRGCCCWMMTP